MKTLKSVVLSAVAASTLCGGTVIVPYVGWNLMGAMENIQTNQYFGDATKVKSLWKWSASEQKWYAYSPDATTQTAISNILQNGLGIPLASSLSAGDGYWINVTSTGATTYTASSTTTTTPATFNAYGYNFVQSLPTTPPSGITYNATGNSVSFNNNIIHLVTQKATSLESRTEMFAQAGAASGATAQMKLIESGGIYNKMQLRTQSNVTIPETMRVDLGLASTNVKSHCMIIVSANEMRAKVILDDGSTTYPTVFNEVMSTSNFLNKQVNLSIQSTQDGNGLVFSATATDANITSKTFTRPTGVTTTGIDTVKVRTQIDNNSQAAQTASADVYGVQIHYPQESNLDIVYSDTTATPVTFDTFTTGIDVEPDSNHWLGSFSLSNGTMSITDYDYHTNESGVASWEMETFSGSLVKDTTNSKIATFTESDGFQGEMTLGETKKVTSINGTSYSNLYATPVSIKVLASGTGWTDTWNWAPMYWDGSASVPVTTNTQLLNMFLTNSNWFGGDEHHAMLAGNVEATSGNIVAGVWDGSYQTNCVANADYDCKIWTKGTEIIGSWSFDATGINMNLPDELQTLSLKADTSSPTGYYVQSIGQDKVGSVWNETMFTGSDATVAKIQAILQPVQ